MRHQTWGVVALCVWSVGCQGPAAPAEVAAVAGTRSALEQAFAQASAESAVPEGLLKAIAYVETRVDGARGGPSVGGGWGPMNLVARDDWNALERAARLSALPLERLQLDEAANVRGAAALLRQLADASFDRYPELDPREAGDYFHAVSLYPGYAGAQDGQQYAAAVFEALEEGFSVQRDDGWVVLAPQPTAWRRHSPAQSARQGLTGTGYPGVAQFIPSPHYATGRAAFEYVVIHTMEGPVTAGVNWFKDPRSRVSAHFLVRSSDGQVTQMVDEANTAWHAECYNDRSVGIEHEGYADAPTRWYTDKMYEESAKLTRWLVDRYSIPLDRSHIIGHGEIPRRCNTYAHYDPGSGWNWTKYMGLVNGAAPTTTTGKLSGLVYEGGDTSRGVSGATVTAGGQTRTTDGTGYFELLLAPGTYTVSVAKAGYSAGTASALVTAGGTAWAHVEVNPAAGKGTLAGKVYVYNPQDPADLSRVVPGASVSLAGQTLTADASGAFRVELSPGAHSVTATAQGYAPNTVTRTVTVGEVTYASVGLSPAGSADAQPPAVQVSVPRDGARLEFAVVEVSGTASDDRQALGEVLLQVNGETAVPVAVTGGTFQQQVKLGPGPNLLKVTARDAAGNVGTAQTTVTFAAGVAGVVHTADSANEGIPDIEVALLNADTGEEVSQAFTGSDGSFQLAVAEVPKDYIFVARSEGFLTHAETVSVPDDRRVRVQIPLAEGQDPTPGEVGIAFQEPHDGAVVPTDQVTLYGFVKGVRVTSVVVNGEPGALVGAGGFAVTVPLAPGTNDLKAVARGPNGEVLTGTLTIIRTDNALLGSAAMGGCASVPGADFGVLWAVAAWLTARARFRKAL